MEILQAIDGEVLGVLMFVTGALALMAAPFFVFAEIWQWRRSDNKTLRALRNCAYLAGGFLIWTAALAATKQELSLSVLNTIVEGVGATSTWLWTDLLALTRHPSEAALLTLALALVVLVIGDIASRLSPAWEIWSRLRRGGSDARGAAWMLALPVVLIVTLIWVSGPNPNEFKASVFSLAAFWLGILGVVFIAPRTFTALSVAGALLFLPEMLRFALPKLFTHTDYFFETAMEDGPLSWILLALVFLFALRHSIGLALGWVRRNPGPLGAAVQAAAGAAILIAGAIWLFDPFDRNAASNSAKAADAWRVIETAEPGAPNRSLVYALRTLRDLDEPIQNLEAGGADLSRMNLDRIDIFDGRFVGADFTRTSLVDAHLSRPDLREAVLEWTKFDDAVLRVAIFAPVDQPDQESSACGTVRNASFVDVSIHATRFGCIQIEDADFRDAFIAVSDFRGTRFTSVDFRFARITDSRTFGYKQVVDYDRGIDAAVIEASDLRGADLSEAWITQEQIDANCVDATTILPEGIVRPADCVETEDGQLRLGNGTIVPEPGPKWNW